MRLAKEGKVVHSKFLLVAIAPCAPLFVVPLIIKRKEQIKFNTNVDIELRLNDYQLNSILRSE